MTVSSSTNRVSYSGNGSLTAFAYTFKVFDEDDLTVILRASDGTETVQTITTHYTVSGVGDAGGGNVTFGTAPASGVTVVILREQPLTQGLDLVPNDPFPAQSVEDTLDKIVFMTQKHEEELSRAIKASRTNVITGSEFTISASDRANKVFAFDASGDVSIAQELGQFKGDWATSTTYVARDIVKDTSTNNIFIVNADHTSSGAQPLTTNANSAKYDLLVDAASATTSATNAAASATAAQTAQTAAETAQTAAETAETNAETAQTASETAKTASETAQAASEAAQAATELVYDNFDDRYLGAKSTSGGNPTVDNDGDALIDGALFFDTTNNVMMVYNLGTTTWLRTTPTTSDQTNINTVSGISANVTTVAGISSNVTTVAGISADVTTVAADGTDIGTVATNIANVNTVAGISGNVTTVAGISADVTTVAGDGTDIGIVATNIANINTVAGISGNVTTVAGISANVTTVAGISADVTAVAGDASDIGVVATNIGGINTIGTVATNISNVNNVGANITNINTVAGAETNINTVATNLGGTNTIGTVAGSIANVNSVGGSIADVNTVASNLTDVQSFANLYRIGSTDPTTSLDTGDLFYNTTSSTLKVYTGSSWEQGVTAGSGFLPLTGGTLTGDLSGTNLTLSGYLRGPSTFTIDPAAHGDNTGTLVVAGNLQVDGTTTTINSTTLSVDDKNITLASGAANAAAADGAGLTVDGASATLTYNSTPDAWSFNKGVNVTSGNVGIGTSSPTAKLTVQTSAGSLSVDALGGGSAQITSPTSLGFNVASAYNHHFYVNSSEVMRIDSSGNLLVGKTTVGAASAGFESRSSGYTAITRDGGQPLEVRRLTSDGVLIDFRKDSTTVASIGTTGNQSYIHGAGTDVGIYFGSNNLYPYRSTGLNDATIDLGQSGKRFKDGYFSGTVNAANFNSTSDATLKTNVETLSGSLDAVMSMRGVSFDWIENGNPEIGVIAQEVEEVLPELVNTNDNGIKSVKYSNIVAVLIEAIKEQQEQIDELKAQLNS